MSLTRSIIDPILISRIGSMFVRAGKDGTTTDGTNADLGAPLAWTLRRIGEDVAAYGACTDADLSAVSDDRIDAVLDIAELRCLMDCQTIILAESIKAGPVSEDTKELASQLDRLVAARLASVSRQYSGVLVVPLVDLSVAGLMSV